LTIAAPAFANRIPWDQSNSTGAITTAANRDLFVNGDVSRDSRLTESRYKRCVRLVSSFAVTLSALSAAQFSEHTIAADLKGGHNSLAFASLIT
jgi:hypothetical protein